MEQLIAISDTQALPAEAKLLNALLAAGLPLLHLRKPGSEASVYSRLLSGIDAVYHDRIVLPYTCLAEGIALPAACRQLHIFEQLRLRMPPGQLAGLKEQGYRLSTSVHNAAAYQALPEAIFDYTFLGPVANSISKPGYPAMDPAELIALTQKHSTRIIGLGGVDAHNCRELMHLGFDGIAISGALWHRPDPVRTLKQIQQWITAGR